MKKKFLKIFLVLLAVTLMPVVFSACKLSVEEQAVVGKFEIVELSVAATSEESNYSYINAASYDHYFMEFKANKRCVISRKTGGKTYTATASWSINAFGEIEVVTVRNRSKSTEIFTLDKHTLFGTNSALANGEEIIIYATFLRTYE